MKGQGLPFSTIVLAIISVLILVLIVFFVTGGFSRIFPATTQYIVTDIQTARTKCQQLLADAQLRLSASTNPNSDFKQTEYCKVQFNISSISKEALKCFSPEIGVYANFRITTLFGEVYRCYTIPSSKTTEGCTCEKEVEDHLP
ncbi:MAG: hypothetical protein BXU00_01700 [Candidatus Nanoclepta minutus]|uniref:Uncharacterized protein n=1 Tax=Candidatus Nanoclepta minutus TaxID=1940235 RepID=A0A397WPM9_9ARCH|nr:MAG: hypothetical protein BXU00_01700 [Candidatus Nanoclepta minutus]